MSLMQKQNKFTRDVVQLWQFAWDLGFTVHPKEWLRTPEQQEIYLKTKKTTTLKSQHLNCLAVDIVFAINGQPIWSKKELQRLGDFWVALDPANNEWGGNWNSFLDTMHFQTKG